MAVGVESDPYSRMPQALGDDLGMDTLLQHKRCVGMTEVMEAKLAYASCLDDAKPSPPKVARLDRRPEGCAEDEILITVARAQHHSVLELSLAVLS